MTLRSSAVRPHKYHAQATIVDNIRFASKAEARRYGELKLLEKAGEISDLELQPRFPLLAASTTGQALKAIDAAVGLRSLVVGEARFDFRYLCPKRGMVVEDVKGYDNKLSSWKRKHAEIQYGITVEVIR